MKHLLYIVLISLCGTLSAQPMLKELPDMVCMDYNKNKLTYPAGKMSMAHFYKKVDSLIFFGNQKLNIVHIGGSHVQADVFTNRMRTNITRMLPGLEAERGVIFPYRVAKTNNPRNYQISYKGVWEKNQNSKFNPNLILGLTGWAVATNDPTASISVKLNCDKGSRWQFDRFRLVGTAQSPDVIPMAIVGTDTIAPIMEPHTNSFLFPCSSTDSITIIFKQNGFTPTLFTISAMIPENNKHGINYHALGVNGASVPAWLRCANFETELKNIKPDLVILAIGINDANVPYGKFSENNFINNYNTLINSIKNVSPHCAILFITNNDAYFRVGRNNRIPNKNGALVQKAFYQLAGIHGAAVWDLYDIMGGLSSMQCWQDQGMANADKIHFTLNGYNLLGDMFYNALITDYLNSH